MLKRTARFLLLCGLGVSLALLVTWVFDRGRSDPASPASGLRTREAATNGTSRASAAPVSASRTDVPTAEASEPPRAGASQAATRETSAAAPVVDAPAAAAAVLPGGSTAREHAADPGDEPPDPDRLAAWCFFTSLDHRLTSDTANVFSGSRSALIEGVPEHRDLRVNSIWQGVDATPYRGSHVELSVYASTAGDTRLFMQTVTQRELDAALAPAAPDAEQNFASAGSGWTRFSIVGNVPRDAVAIFFGFGNYGAAPLWLDSAAITGVGAEAPVTGGRTAPFVTPVVRPVVLGAPANLDFELTIGATGQGPGC